MSESEATSDAPARPRRRRRLVIAGSVLLVVLLLVVRRLDVDPPDIASWQPAERAPLASPPEPSRDPGPWLLVHEPAESGAATAQFSDNDWSYAWLNTLEQGFGRADVVSPSDLIGGALDRAEVVVLSRRAGDLLDPGAVAALTSFVESGGTLVLDRPAGTVARLSGVELSGERFPAERITTEPREDWHDLLPLVVEVEQLASPPADGIRTLLAMDGRPAVVERPLGSGLVVSMLFDYPRQLVAVQQGVPEAGYRIEKRFGKYDWLFEPEDVVVDERLLDNPVPCADLLEDWLVDRMGARRPMARWWRFPADREGAFLMTHDEDLQGGAELAVLTEYEKTIGATSTTFIIPNRRLWETWKSPVDWYTVLEEEHGADLQLHWNVLSMPIGVWKIEPFLVRYSLPHQIELLERDIERPFANRTHYLILGDHYTKAFRLLEKQGIRWDTTYGPNRGGRGYQFGTGLPYRPLDTNGNPFALREIPFVTQEDWGEASPEFLERLLRESESRYHQVIIPIFHAHLIVKEPEGEAFWKQSYEDAKATNHWITSFFEWDAFWTARRESALRSTYRARDGVLEADFDAARDDLAILLPMRVGERRLASVEVAGRPVEPVPTRFGEVRCARVPVPGGGGRLVARYEEP